MPAYCLCGQLLSVQHALLCICSHKGDIHQFGTMNHGISLRLCCLQPVMELLLSPLCNLSSAKNSHTSLPTLKMGLAWHIVPDGFWCGSLERAFFEVHVKIFNPFAFSNNHSFIQVMHWHHENLKK